MCIVIETTRSEVHNSGPMFTYYIVQCVSIPSVWRDDGERSDDESLYSAYATKIAICECVTVSEKVYMYIVHWTKAKHISAYTRTNSEKRLYVRRRLNPRPYQRRAVLHMRSIVSCALYINETRLCPYVMPCHTNTSNQQKASKLVRFDDAVYSSRSRICRLGQCAASTVNPCRRPVYIKDVRAQENRFLDRVSSVRQSQSTASN